MNMAPTSVPPAAPPRRLYMGKRVRRLGQSLLTQQCWCWGWGRDVTRPDGNLLLQYGFTRHRPPGEESGATTYIWRDGGRTVALWGFGLFYGEEGCGASSGSGLFIGRFDFEPKLAPDATPPQPVWTPDQLTMLRVPHTDNERRRARELLSAALAWIAAYEEWALQTAGLEYRCRCLQAWQQNFLPPQDVAPLWRRLSGRFAAASRSDAHRAFETEKGELP